MNDSVNRRRRELFLGMLALPVSGLAAVAASTPPGSEGPFYPTAGMRFADVDNDLVKIGSAAERAGGEVVELVGRVLDRNGDPVMGARVEIWQCDANGRYLHRGDAGGSSRDNAFQGFGHDITGADGRYSFRTIKPVPYPGRTPHIHVKVILDKRERLTTQFYLQDHPYNKRDWLYLRVPEDKRELVTMNFSAAGALLPQANLDIVI